MYYQYKLIAKVVTNLIFFHSWVFLQSGDLRTRRPWSNCKASVISWLWCAGIYTEGTYFKDAPTIVVEFHPITAEHNSTKKNIYSWCVLNQSHHMKKTNSMQFKCHDPHPKWPHHEAMDYTSLWKVVHCLYCSSTLSYNRFIKESINHFLLTVIKPKPWV